MDSYFYRFEEESLDPKESIREKTHLVTIHLHEWIFTYQDNFKINVLVSVTFIITRLTEIDIAPLPLFRMCIFEAAHGMRGGGRWAERSLLPTICYTYPTMVKLGTVIPYLKEIQKIYESQFLLTSPEISKFCYIKKYRFRLHFGT